MLASIIIRTLNEEKYLDTLIEGIKLQVTNQLTYEIIIVDSGSTDSTLLIAEKHSCHIYHLTKEEFSFGRSLNLGCENAKGDILVFISGHCVPTDNNWLESLCIPICNKKAVMCYGRQIGGPTNRYSESQLLEKNYPIISKIPQEGFFCNNANSALLKSVWKKYRFCEKLTGLEDMLIGKKIVQDGESIAYTSAACVFHHHLEKWHTVRRRYEREAIALRQIMPEIHISFFDFLRYYFSGVFLDFSKAIQEKVFFSKFIEIVIYRFMQFWGSYKGNHEHRKLSKEQKETYFFPK